MVEVIKTDSVIKLTLHYPITGRESNRVFQFEIFSCHVWSQDLSVKKLVVFGPLRIDEGLCNRCSNYASLEQML